MDAARLKGVNERHQPRNVRKLPGAFQTVYIREFPVWISQHDQSRFVLEYKKCITMAFSLGQSISFLS
jgi:hypothetical protein